MIDIMFVQILWKSVTFKLPKKKRTIDSPVLTHLSNSVLAGSRVKEIWPRYYIMIVIRDIIPFRKLTGDHFGGNLGIISGSRDYFGGSKIARKWYSLALSSLPRSMIPERTIRSLHQSRLTLVALATINLLRPLSLIPPFPFPWEESY